MLRYIEIDLVFISIIKGQFGDLTQNPLRLL